MIFITIDGADRRRRTGPVPVQSALEPLQGQGRRAAIPGGQRRSNGRRRRPRRRMATGARNCRSSIAGPMITAFPARPRISFRRTSRIPRTGRESTHHERHADLPRRACASIIIWWMAQQRLTSKPWLESARAERHVSDYAVIDTDCKNRPRCVSCRRRRSLHPLHQRLLHAHGTAGLVGDAPSRRPLGEYGRADRQQRGSADGQNPRHSKTCRRA